ncbi:MAG: hypothetical protein HHJ09_10200 [Glaciimonas sp.]|nr:hypothetical protein [Glaciimonas sp.]
MNRPVLLLFLLPFLAGLLLTSTVNVWAEPNNFDFGVIAHTFQLDAHKNLLQQTINASNAENLAFVVVNGIKSSTESCSDNVYSRSRKIFSRSENALIISLAASDWADCKTKNGKSIAIQKLNRARELFFSGDVSFGSTSITLVRQTSSAKFRSYAENARWEYGNVLFATVNLPVDNNHYLPDAGRNSEFEDRLIANREWLERIFIHAAQRKNQAIVLFCDGNPLVVPNAVKLSKLAGRRDGFIEARKQLTALAKKFPGKLLLLHSDAQAKPDTLHWQANIGSLGLRTGWAKISVRPASRTLFRLATSSSTID